MTSKPVAEVRRNTSGGMAYMVPLVPPEHLTHGMKLYDRAGVVTSSINPDGLIRKAYDEGRRDEREACAKLCEGLWEIDGTATAAEFAKEIRARGIVTAQAAETEGLRPEGLEPGRLKGDAPKPVKFSTT